MKESVRKFIIIFFIILAYTSQCNRRNFINEVIQEEDEDKNIINKENEIKKDNIKLNNNKINDKVKIVISNNNEYENVQNNNMKNIDDNMNALKNEKEENNNKRNKNNIFWNNSPFNKKINTYENIFNKKTFDKYVSVRDKLIENKNGIILPDLKNINNSNLNSKNFESLNIKKSYNSKKMNLRSISTDKAKMQQNININSITNDTSAFTNSSKKYYSPMGIGNQNYTEDLSKFRMGLLSAGSSSNNNIIIPMISMRRPVSNFNFGGGQLWNFDNTNKSINSKNAEDKPIINDEDKNINNINNNLKKEEEDKTLDAEFSNKKLNINLSSSKKNYNIYNKPKPNNGSRNKSFKSQDMTNFPITNDINNIYIGMDKMINKLHKIKIEKGMMNSGILNSLNKKFNNDYQNQIEQFKKSHLPMMFNNQNSKTSKTINLGNNIDKNKSIRSHSLNNRNNPY